MFNFMRSAPPQPSLTPDEISRLVASGEMSLVDVREMAEVRASGKAKGAQVIPLSILGLKCDPKSADCLISHNKPVALYCASGGRSSMAAQTLARMGYDQVHNLGGLGDWVAAGGQVERI